MKQVRHEESKTIGTFTREEGKHYVFVEKETKRVPDYVSPMPEMLESGYKVVSDERKVTGNSNLVLMEIDKAEYEAKQAEYETEAKTAAKSTPAQPRANEWDKTEVGALSINQLAASIAPEQPPLA